jgi:hypothetical protein
MFKKKVKKVAVKAVEIDADLKAVEIDPESPVGPGIGLDEGVEEDQEYHDQPGDPGVGEEDIPPEHYDGEADKKMREYPEGQVHYVPASEGLTGISVSAREDSDGGEINIRR